MLNGMASDAPARQMVAVSDGDVELIAPCRGEPQPAYGRGPEEVMCGAYVEKRKQALPINRHWQQHAVLHAYL